MGVAAVAEAVATNSVELGGMVVLRRVVVDWAWSCFKRSMSMPVCRWMESNGSMDASGTV